MDEVVLKKLRIAQSSIGSDLDSGWMDIDPRLPDAMAIGHQSPYNRQKGQLAGEAKEIEPVERLIMVGPVRVEVLMDAAQGLTPFGLLASVHRGSAVGLLAQFHQGIQY